jgi:hypothetical protein
MDFRFSPSHLPQLNLSAKSEKCWRNNYLSAIEMKRIVKDRNTKGAEE